MRTINQLLIILRDHTEEYMESGSLGLCAVSLELSYDEIITNKEDYTLSNYIETNMPMWGEGVYGWTPRKIKPRLDWLDKQIKETK